MTITANSAPHETRLHPGRVWTPAAIRDLGVTTDIETAGAIVGIGRSKAYALAHSGNFPVRIIRIGRRYVVPIADILDLLGMDR